MATTTMYIHSTTFLTPPRVSSIFEHILNLLVLETLFFYLLHISHSNIPISGVFVCCFVFDIGCFKALGIGVVMIFLACMSVRYFVSLYSRDTSLSFLSYLIPLSS